MSFIKRIFLFNLPLTRYRVNYKQIIKFWQSFSAFAFSVSAQLFFCRKFHKIFLRFRPDQFIRSHSRQASHTPICSAMRMPWSFSPKRWPPRSSRLFEDPPVHGWRAPASAHNHRSHPSYTPDRGFYCSKKECLQLFSPSEYSLRIGVYSDIRDKNFPRGYGHSFCQISNPDRSIGADHLSLGSDHCFPRRFAF